MFSQTPYAKAFLEKQAFVPYTQEAMNPPAQEGAMPPEAAAAGGAMPPAGGAMPPEAAGGMPPQQGGGAAPQIQIVQGPNGEPIDAETGFIVLDPQQGIEQDPLTGILFNRSLNEFATPEGQPLPPEQAIQMIEQARQQAGEAGAPQGASAEQMPPDAAAAGGMPPEGGAMPPAAGAMPPEAAGAMPPDAAGAPPVPQQGPNQTFDPSTGMMMDDATGMPIDPSTGMIVDPTTGQKINPQTGMPAVQQGGGDMPFTDDPEVLKTFDSVAQEVDHLSKDVAKLNRTVNAFRTDLQGVRRAIEAVDDSNDANLQQMQNLLQVAQQLIDSRAEGYQMNAPQTV